MDVMGRKDYPALQNEATLFPLDDRRFERSHDSLCVLSEGPRKTIGRARG